MILPPHPDGTDFFYGAGRLAGADLYDWNKQVEAMRDYASDPKVFPRPPFIAALMKPFTYLPYSQALAVWQVLNAAALFGFIVLYCETRDDVARVALFAPLYLAARPGTGFSVAIVRIRRWYTIAGKAVLLRGWPCAGRAIRETTRLFFGASGLAAVTASVRRPVGRWRQPVCRIGALGRMGLARSAREGFESVGCGCGLQHRQRVWNLLQRVQRPIPLDIREYRRIGDSLGRSPDRTRRNTTAAIGRRGIRKPGSRVSRDNV